VAGAAGEPFVFHGQAGEYFRIWIVNLLLTVLTAGVFAAWAKVRKRRYLRGNLELLGHRFHYTANPWRLLVGNVLIVSLFIGYSLFGAVYPVVRLIAVGAGLCLLPWIIVRSLGFNAHNTVYRGVRFRFHRSLGAATIVYLFQGLVTLVSLGFYYPSWARAKRQFLVERHRFGTGYFRVGVGSAPFYSTYYLAGGAVLGAIFFAGVSMYSLKGFLNPVTVAMIVTFGVYLPVLYFARQFVHARIFNAVWNGTRLDECRFSAAMCARRWMGLQLGNWAAILGTAGLAYPWTVIRNARYTASCLRYFPTEDFYRLRKLGSAPGSAVGESAAEFIGLDFGL
jgi:uncharacterized membrane protein YjgN (DUF898 family)